MRILYVNHTGEVSGAERSLLELLAGLPVGDSAVLGCPEGQLAVAARVLGIPVVAFPQIGGGLRPHPYHTPKTVTQIGRAGLAIRRHARRTRADIVHANSIRAGLAGSLAARLGAPPVLVHVHDCLPDTRVATLTRRVLERGAALAVANSNHTAGRLLTGARRLPVRVVHNGVDLERFDPGRFSREAARAALGLDGESALLGIVGQITPWKGQETGIRIIAELRRIVPQARLLMVGDAKFQGGSSCYDNARYRRRLSELVNELGVRAGVVFLDERRDVPAILAALDLLLVPSWDEPFGRVAIEAMAMQLPVVASNVGGLREIIVDGQHGVLLPPGQVKRWADVISSLLADPGQRTQMGYKGRIRAAAQFGRQRYVNGVLDAYAEILGGGSALNAVACHR